MLLSIDVDEETRDAEDKVVRTISSCVVIYVNSLIQIACSLCMLAKPSMRQWFC